MKDEDIPFNLPAWADYARVKRAILQKARRARIIKQLTSMGRRHLLEVRIVMKNMVYVVGMKIPGTGDEVSQA